MQGKDFDLKVNLSTAAQFLLFQKGFAMSPNASCEYSFMMVDGIRGFSTGNLRSIAFGRFLPYAYV